MPFDLIITDLTEMSVGNYCVAGWEAHVHHMVRPLPDGRNWTGALLQQHGVRPGATVRFEPNGQVHPGQFPHRTEDTQVCAAQIQRLAPGPIAWSGTAAPPTHATLQAAFGGNLQHNSVWNGNLQGIYVPVGTQICSLSAVRLARQRVSFVEEFAKLKAVLDDGHASYKLPVSSVALKSAWRQGGLAAVGVALAATPLLHIRLGFARAFGNPADKCYLMVNGIQG